MRKKKNNLHYDVFFPATEPERAEGFIKELKEQGYEAEFLPYNGTIVRTNAGERTLRKLMRDWNAQAVSVLGGAK